MHAIGRSGSSEGPDPRTLNRPPPAEWFTGVEFKAELKRHAYRPLPVSQQGGEYGLMECDGGA